MTDAQPRPSAPSPESDYVLTIDEVAELYATAGFPRPTRRLQKYCARGDLDCRKVETSTGEKYLITTESIERHISYIKETTAAAGRGPTHPGAPGRRGFSRAIHRAPRNRKLLPARAEHRAARTRERDQHPHG